jgi:hypothetical protein
MTAWRDIPGFEGYRISDAGTVVRLDGGAVSTSTHKEGYLIVSIGSPRQKMLVHRLVLESFVGPAPEGHLTRHLNGDPSDNHLSNLTWGTQQENMLDSVRHGTRATGSENGNSRLVLDEVEAIRREYATGLVSQRSLAARYDVSQKTIFNIVKEKQWRNS